MVAQTTPHVKINPDLKENKKTETLATTLSFQILTSYFKITANEGTTGCFCVLFAGQSLPLRKVKGGDLAALPHSAGGKEKILQSGSLADESKSLKESLNTAETTQDHKVEVDSKRSHYEKHQLNEKSKNNFDEQMDCGRSPGKKNENETRMKKSHWVTTREILVTAGMLTRKTIYMKNNRLSMMGESITVGPLATKIRRKNSQRRAMTRKKSVKVGLLRMRRNSTVGPLVTRTRVRNGQKGRMTKISIIILLLARKTRLMNSQKGKVKRNSVMVWMVARKTRFMNSHMRTMRRNSVIVRLLARKTRLTNSQKGNMKRN